MKAPCCNGCSEGGKRADYQSALDRVAAVLREDPGIYRSQSSERKAVKAQRSKGKRQGGMGRGTLGGRKGGEQKPASQTRSPDPARGRWWTHAQAVAWIAFRSFDAVRDVASEAAAQKRKDGSPRNPMLRLIVSIGLERSALKPGASGTSAHDLHEASCLLAPLEEQGKLTRDSSGRYLATEIKKFFPSD